MPPSSCCWVDALPPVVASSLADALPPFFFSGGCFAAVVVLFGGCFATVSCSLSWHLWRQYILFLQVQLFGWQVWSALLFLALAVCVFVCTFLQYFSVFSPLWSCIGQVLFGHIKSVSVTAFFLMKNVLRHGREKKLRKAEYMMSRKFESACKRKSWGNPEAAGRRRFVVARGLELGRQVVQLELNMTKLIHLSDGFGSFKPPVFF